MNDHDQKLEEYLRGFQPIRPLFGKSSRLGTPQYPLRNAHVMAKGQTKDAVETWLDGVRFSQDVAKGGPLIFKLIARAGLLLDFQALSGAARAGRLSAKQKVRVATAIRSLPSDILDWSEALGLEEVAFESAVEEMRQSKSPAAVYQKSNGERPPANFALPRQEDVLALRSVIIQAQTALRLPPPQARAQLEEEQKRIAEFGWFFQRAIPSLLKINEARAEIESARTSLLETLGS